MKRTYCTSLVFAAAAEMIAAMIILLLISGKHEARTSAEGKQGEKSLGPWGKWVAMGIRHTIRRWLEGRPKGSEDLLRSEGRNLGQSTATLGFELVGLSSLGVGSTFSWCGHFHGIALTFTLPRETAGCFSFREAGLLIRICTTKHHFRACGSSVALKPL